MKPGDSFTKEVHFDAASIAAFATLTGDTNPLHHDPAYAATTHFGGIIASGSHVTALMLGLVAGNAAEQGPNVGLDFSFRAGDTILFRWTMTDRTPKPSLKGDIVTMHGEAIRPDGVVAVSSTGHAVFFTQ
jgi:acyl dehydratase